MFNRIRCWPGPSFVLTGILPACLLGAGSLLPGWSASPTIDRWEPFAIRPGHTTEFTFHGDHFDASTWLWTSFPAATLRVHKADDASQNTVRFQSTLADDAQPGLAAVRLVSKKGLSPLRLILIDDLSSVGRDRENHTKDSSQLLHPPIAVDGRMEDLKMDYYQMDAKEGDRISVEVVAARIGSQLDPLLRLLDAEGRELAYLDDEPGIRPDLRLRHVFQKSGTYWLELRDVTYRGGRDSFYRLRLGDFPLVTVTYPMTLPTGKPTPLKPLGRSRDLEDVPGATIVLPSGKLGTFWPARFAPQSPSAYVRIEANPSPLREETEPNDQVKEATRFEFPVALAGRLERDQDRDYFQFQLPKSERLMFTSRTRTLGSPCDLWMQIEDATGKKLAEAKISGDGDTSLNFQAPADGNYTLMIEELNRIGGPDFAYEINVASPQPGFTLSLEQDRAQAAPGETLSLNVEADRDNYDGPIELTVWALGQQVSSPHTVIAKKETKAEIKISVPEGWTPGRLYALRVEGRATIDNGEVVRTATIRPALKKQFPNTQFFPFGLEAGLALGVVEKE